MLFLAQWIIFLCLSPFVVGECLKAGEADRILKRYLSLFVKVKPSVAADTVTKGLKFYSDSLDFLYTPGLPGSLSGVPFWSNREDFIAGQQYAQEQRKNTTTDFEFRILQWSYGCDHIVFHWRGDGQSKGNLPGSTNQAGDPIGIAGIDYMLLNTNSTPKKVKEVYSEFNLGEVLYTSGQKICFQKNNDDACTCPSGKHKLLRS